MLKDILIYQVINKKAKTDIYQEKRNLKKIKNIKLTKNLLKTETSH